MTPREKVLDLFAQWLELGRAEGHAIQSADWPKLANLQARKENLKTPLALAKINFLNATGATSLETVFPTELGRLISLANRNAALLTRQMNAAKAHEESLGQAHRNLKKVQSRYAPPLSSSLWNFYS